MISNIYFYIVFGGITILSGSYIYAVLKKIKDLEKNNNKKLIVEI